MGQAPFQFAFERPKPQYDTARLITAALAGAFVAFALGIYGRVHDPQTNLALTLGFETTISMKVWLATGAVLFAVFQLLSALWMYGRLPLGEAPEWAGGLHRISGRIAFLLSLPVAYHCLYELGFQNETVRGLFHSLFGCMFFGAFAAKVVIVRSERLPGIALPIAGGLVFALLVLVWWTSGLWFIRENGFPSA